jgi:NTP pyrophosphatase (non-canonical NTP hydrolase)
LKIGEFQRHIAELYLAKDKRRGAEGTMLWLIEEVGEMTEAARRKDLNELGAEMADVLAWTASLANLYGVDLEDAVAKKYPATCARCGAKPCQCPEPTTAPL